MSTMTRAPVRQPLGGAACDQREELHGVRNPLHRLPLPPDRDRGDLLRREGQSRPADGKRTGSLEHQGRRSCSARSACSWAPYSGRSSSMTIVAAGGGPSGCRPLVLLPDDRPCRAVGLGLSPTVFRCETAVHCAPPRDRRRADRVRTPRLARGPRAVGRELHTPGHRFLSEDEDFRGDAPSSRFARAPARPRLVGTILGACTLRHDPGREWHNPMKAPPCMRWRGLHLAFVVKAARFLGPLSHPSAFTEPLTI